MQRFKNKNLLLSFRYAEVCRYNFEDPDPASKETAHFSQLVWNASNELGIGVAQKDVNDEHCWFIVARYRPQGNKDGKEEFKRNVKKGTFDPIVNNCVSISDEMWLIHIYVQNLNFSNAFKFVIFVRLLCLFVRFCLLLLFFFVIF